MICRHVFLFFWDRLLPASKNIKKTSLPQSIKISKTHALDAKGFNFDDLWMPFGSPFSINFPDRQNLLICNMYNTKTSFLQVRASYFGIKKSIKESCFFCQPPFLDLIFHILFWFVPKVVDLGPLQNPVGAKTGPTNRPSGAIIVKNIDTQSFRDRLEKRKYMQKRQLD